jgi:nucleoid-associated protein YgaU
MARVATTLAVTSAAEFWCWHLVRTPASHLLRLATAPSAASLAVTPDTVVVDIAATLLLVAAAGLSFSIALNVTALALRRRLPRLSRACIGLTPHFCQRFVVMTCGVGLAAPLALGSAAIASPLATHATHRYSGPAGRAEDRLAGLSFPDLPTLGQGKARVAGRANRDAARDPGHPEGSVRVVVRPGDSLWSIAAGRLTPDAPPAQIAALVGRLYAANRAVIGTNPDLILPGMSLIAPEATR